MDKAKDCRQKWDRESGEKEERKRMGKKTGRMGTIDNYKGKWMKEGTKDDTTYKRNLRQRKKK